MYEIMQMAGSAEFYVVVQLKKMRKYQADAKQQPRGQQRGWRQSTRQEMYPKSTKSRQRMDKENTLLCFILHEKDEKGKGP